MAKTLIAFVLMAFALPSTAMAAQKYSACAKEKDFKTKIYIDLQIPDPVYDLTKSRQELTDNTRDMHETWLKKNGMEGVWKATEMETLGLAAGGTAVISENGAIGKPYDRYGTAWCPYFTSVRVNIMYRTIINIPKNFKQDGCMFGHIQEHELRHHATNATVTTEIAARLEKDLPTIIAEIEGSMPYATKPQLQSRVDTMRSYLSDAIKIYMVDSMRYHMGQRNALIDTPEEYKRSGVLMRECKDK